MTIVFVSHALRALCDRATALNKGRILGIGDTEKVVADYLASIRGGEGQVESYLRPFKLEGDYRQNQ